MLRYSRLLVALLVPLLAITAGVLSGQPSPAATQDSVSIAAPDGGFIHGDLYGRGTRGVVLIAHGGYSYKARWEPQARALAAAGFRVLAFDTRAGETLRLTGKETECLSDAVCMAVDVLAVVRYLRSAGAQTIAVVAGSAGGGAAAQASVEAGPGAIDRLVLLAPMAIAAPEKITGRKLYITSRNDRNGDGLRLPGIREQYNKAPNPKRLVILEGSAHGQLMFDAPEGERVMREILSFLRER